MLYKVVSNARPDKLVSAYAYGQFECSYSPDTWTTAPVGGLLCFSTLDAAKEFLCDETREDLELWECEGEDPVTLGLWDIRNPTDGWASISEFPDLWWPAGTVAFRRVKLLQRIPFELPAC